MYIYIYILYYLNYIYYKSIFLFIITVSQKSLNSECDKKTCLWKYRVTDLQDQVKILQHEVFNTQILNI